MTAAVKPHDVMTTWRTSLDAMRYRDPFTEARKAIEISRTDVLTELNRVAAVALAPKPVLEDLLAASLVAYENLYGRYVPPRADWRRSPQPEAKAPVRRKRRRRRARRRAQQPATPAATPRLPADEASLATQLEKLEAASRRRDISLLVLEVILSTIIALLMMLYQNQLSNESEQRIVSRIAAVEAAITERLAAVERDEDHRAIVYARRELSLQSGPRSRANDVATWYPNVPGRVVAERKYWMRIEYFDAEQNEHVAGWCRKKWVLRPRAGRLTSR
jgi:hypothetical protein